MDECFFWYRLIWVVPDRIHRAVKRLCVCVVCRKKLIDEDDREIRLLQEQFLPDGDLHSDGIGRMRRFRWNNIGMSLMLLMHRIHN